MKARARAALEAGVVLPDQARQDAFEAAHDDAEARLFGERATLPA